MNRELLREALTKRPLLGDGAMGTQLFRRGLAPGECGERWNMERPDDVLAIHEEFAQAGCELLTTNTFGGTAASLERHGLAEYVRAFNEAGAALAKKAAGERAWVLGDMGPFGGFLEPVGDMTVQELGPMFAAQAQALIAGGADGLIIETMVDPAEMVVAIAAAKSVTSRPVLATYSFEKAGDTEFRTIMGTSVADALAAAIDAGADVVGANCGTSLGLDGYVRLVQVMVDAIGASSRPDTPIILQPNAGSPQTRADGELFYAAAPADMAVIVPRLLQLSVRVIGGCCGTTPQHLRAMGQAMCAAGYNRPV